MKHRIGIGLQEKMARKVLLLMVGRLESYHLSCTVSAAFGGGTRLPHTDKAMSRVLLACGFLRNAASA